MARYIEILRSVNIFAGLSDEELEQIGEYITERELPKGAVLYEQGEPGDALYIVRAGRLKATVTDASGRERVLAIYGNGDFFGELALVSAQPRTATVTAVTDSNLLVLRREDFEKFLANNLQAMRRIIGVITERQTMTPTVALRQTVESQTVTLGKVLAVFSPKGGVGRTTIAVNLALAAAQLSDRKIVLVDGDLTFGDVGVMLNLPPTRTISDLIPYANQLDEELLDTILATHPSGLRVLLAPPKPELADLVTPEHMSLIVARLRELFDYVIVDTMVTLNDLTLAILDAADKVLVVTTPEIPAIKNVRAFLDTASALGYPADKIEVILNRADASPGLDISQVEATLGRRFTARIASGGLAVVEATNRGVPVVLSEPGSEVAQGIYSLVKTLVPEATAIPPRAAGPRLRRAPSETSAIPTADDLLYGWGLTAVATVMPAFVGAVLGLMLTAVRVVGPESGFSNTLVNLGIWVGIVAGSFLLVMSRGPENVTLLAGALVGLGYGALVGMAVLAVRIAAGVTVANYPLALVPAILFYAVLGVVGVTLGWLARGRRPEIRLRRLKPGSTLPRNPVEAGTAGG
jgi:Flp pilus assembly CpaE family ATPase